MLGLEKKKKKQNCEISTHQEEHAEVGQFSKEFLQADSVRVKGKVAAEALVELLHVLVHGGEFLVLLSSVLAEAVRGKKKSRKRKRDSGLKHSENMFKANVRS